jgi:hypothetical protein
LDFSAKVLISTEGAQVAQEETMHIFELDEA